MANPLIFERYTKLVQLLREFTSSAVYEQSEANQHFMRLWLQLLGLCNSLALLAQHGDAPAAQIILRTQLEIFAHLQYFRAKPDEAWLTERANEMAQWLLIQRHHDSYPMLPYSMSVQHSIDQQRQKWSDVTFKRGKDGRESVENTKSIRAIFKAIADAQLIGMSAYGLYQILCGESHARMLNVAARHTASGQPSMQSQDFGDENLVALKMSAWFLGELAKPVLDRTADHSNRELDENIRQTLKSICE